MTDRELLELAAKAAGIKALYSPDGVFRDCTGFHPAQNIYAAKPWNPLTDDGDALRLAVKLGLAVSAADPRFVEAAIFKDGEAHLLFRDGTMDSQWNEDPYAATRRAIVRAAAEIGKEMK